MTSSASLGIRGKGGVKKQKKPPSVGVELRASRGTSRGLRSWAGVPVTWGNGKKRGLEKEL